MDFSFVAEYYPVYIDGTKITILLSLFTLLFGFIVGVFVCMAKMSKNKVVSLVATSYIELIRGTPLLVQLYIVYFGLPRFGLAFPDIGPIKSAYLTAVFALTINAGAYISEILRSGIQSIDKGQMEASRSLGLSHWESMRLVIIPQALKNVLPALANEFIVLVKESAIVSLIGIKDLMYGADIIKAATYRPLEALIVAAIIYFVLTFTLSKLVGLLEIKMQGNKVKKNVSIHID